MTDEEESVFALIENLQREDLNAVEEAEGIKTLIDTFGFTQEQAAQKLGKSRTAVTNSLRLLNLPDSVGSLLKDGKISMGHARALLAVEDEAASASGDATGEGSAKPARKNDAEKKGGHDRAQRHDSQKQRFQRNDNQGHRHQRPRRGSGQREMQPSVNKEELAKLKVADLRAKAAELGITVLNEEEFLELLK